MVPIDYEQSLPAGTIAFSLDGSCVSEKRFHRDIASLQNKLERSFHQSTVRLALSCKSVYTFAVALRSVVGLGHDIIMLPNQLPQTLALHQSDFDAVISDQQVESSELSVIYLRSSEIEEEMLSQRAPNLAFNNCRIHMFTSGSTSEPKLVIKHLQQLLKEADTLNRLFYEQISESRFVASVSHQHIYGTLFYVLLPLLSQRPFCIDIIEFQEQLQRLPNDKYILVSSPAFLRCLRKNDGAPLHLAAIFSSGGPLSYEQNQNASAAIKSPIIEILGSTETGGIAWRQQTLPDTPWQPLPKVTVETGKDKTLVVTSPYAGGVQQLEDKIEVLTNGSFRHLGRADRVVKIAEKRLSLVELEAYIETSPLVLEAAALPISRGGRQHIALALSLTSAGWGLFKTHGKRQCNIVIKQYLQQRFERVLLPRYFRYCEQLPVNTQGKRVHKQIQALFLTEDT